MDKETLRITKEFVHSVRHRMVTMDLTDSQLCDRASIDFSEWCDITDYSKAPSIELMCKAYHFVGITWRLTLEPKPKEGYIPA